MPFPIVAVTLPEDTPPAYVAGLLSACTQAYARGTCKSDSEHKPQLSVSSPTEMSPQEAAPGATVATSPTSTSSEGGAPESVGDEGEGGENEAPILATVSWSSPTSVSLLLGLPHWRNHRWLERAITFQEEDLPLERHRAIGFTIGSLAGTVSEVARLEQEAREPEAKSGDSGVNPEAPPSVNPPIPKPEATDTRQAKDVQPLPPPGPEPASHWFVRGYLGGELGEGLDALRRGGTLGIGVYDAAWGTHLSGYYSDGSGNGLEATFAGIELTMDVRLLLRSVEAQLSIGGGYGLVNARVTKEQSDAFPSAVVALQVMPVEWTLAPYVGVGARVFRGIATDVPGLDHLGPITPFVQVGLALSSESK